MVGLRRGTLESLIKILEIVMGKKGSIAIENVTL